MLRRGRKFLCSIDQARSSASRQKSGVLGLRNALNYKETRLSSRNYLCVSFTAGQDRTILGTVHNRSGLLSQLRAKSWDKWLLAFGLSSALVGLAGAFFRLTMAYRKLRFR